MTFIFNTVQKIKEIKVPYIKTESVEEFGDFESPEFETVFVIADFQDSIFNKLYKADCRILGPPIVLRCAQKGEVSESKPSVLSHCSFTGSLL